MQKATLVGLGVALLSIALHCVGGKPTPADATQALRFACEALAVSVTTGTHASVDEVIRKSCHVEQVLERMHAVVRASELPDLVQTIDDWDKWPAVGAHDAGAR